MRYTLDSFTTSLPWFSAHWTQKKSDKKIAKVVIAFLEDRRVLFGQWTGEVPTHSLQSVFGIREFLRGQITSEDMGSDLSNTLKAMQAACRRFIDAAGDNGENFSRHRRFTGGLTLDAFAIALGDFRATMGFYIAALATQYEIDIHEDLAEILPPNPEIDLEDPTWSPSADKYWRLERD
jgi:hypothetical protein